MTLSLDELVTIYPDKVYLEFSPQEQEEAWLQAQSYSNNAARWNAYLNLLCLKVFVAYLKEEPDLQGQPIEIDLNGVSRGADSWGSSIWEFVNGTAIKLGNTRVVIIPEDVSGTDEGPVPQEWVDIPSWAADYYVIMQLNLQDGWLHVCGYTTHRQLKEKGEYDRRVRTYSLDTDDLIKDLNVMWVAQELCSAQKAEIVPLPTLSPTQAENLLARLGKPSTYSPRLDIPFEQWAALLVDQEWREQLYRRRLDKVQGTVGAAAMTVGGTSKSLANWSKMLENFVEDGWQTVEEIRTLLGTQELKLAYGFGGTRFREGSSSIQKVVSGLIELLQTSKDKETSLSAVQLLGEIGQGSSEAIAALSEFAKTSNDGDLRRQAAVILGKIEVGNPQAGVRRVKIIDLGMQLDTHRVALVVTLIPEADGETNVHLRVHPTGESNYLPPNLQLIVVNEKGEKFLEAQSRSADNWIQLELSGEDGDSFVVKLVLGEASFAKEFVL